MSDSQLFMVRAELDQPALMRFAARSRLPIRIVDGGYIVHAALNALFGDLAPRPFMTRHGRGRRITLLGYAAVDHRALADRGHALADPLTVATVDLSSMCSKPMPMEWRAGAVYRFETRVCPVVRISGRANREASREVDVFIHRCLRVGPVVFVDREATYREWLRGELARSGASRLREAHLVSFQRQRLSRRDRSGNQAPFKFCERPDATLTGILEVARPETFEALIRRGLGRHRGFGFGMLLLTH